MNASVAAVLNGSPCQSGEPSNTPDLQPSRYMSGESDDDSAHPTPSDMTPAAQVSPHESWPSTKTMRADYPIRAEEEVRKIHYIETPAQHPSPPTTMPSALLNEQSATSTAQTASPRLADGTHSFAASAPNNAISPPPPTVVIAASQATHSGTPTPIPIQALPNTSTATPAASRAALSGLPSAAVLRQTPESTAEALPSHLATTAPSSAASTPASTPGATPQTYARKRGRPRKHPLPDPNNPPPPKTKRKLSADAAAAKKKASANAAARSAASNAASLLSVPDLGRLIPQGSSSDNAQSFIQNNLRLFADLFVALQKQASSDHATRDEANAELNGIAQVSAGRNPVSAQNQALSIADEPMPASSEATATEPKATTETAADRPSGSSTAALATPLSKVSGPSDAICDEIKKKMAEVSKGREAIQAEMLQMRVDASFFETAQKTVDERIVILRERIAKHTAVLEREREATRKVREATRKAKQDRKAREKSLRDSEREERRLAQTFVQLEKEIAAEEEERRRLEEVDSDDEEGDQAENGIEHGATTGALVGPDEFNVDVVATSPSDGTSASDIATPPVSNGAPAAADRAIGFSDEELAKVLGISTSELAGFSQTLELTSLQPPSDPVSGQEAANSSHLDPSSSVASILSAGLDSNEQPAADGPDVAGDNFDIAAFLEMASSFGHVSEESAPAQQ
ncbi:hypothetical protein NDA16_002080 [Ustilago loliicola]|nr:hypothetical protein NDA16_002080 [Ustilago loliicola]